MLSILPALFGFLVAFFLIQFLIRRERRKKKFFPFTEPFLRTPGYTLHLKLDDLETELFVYILLLFLPPIYFFVQTKGSITPDSYFLLGMCLLLVVYGVYEVSRIYHKAQPLKLGYYGELYTGQELNYLMQQGAFVYHDIPYQYGNIDHLVVSRGGVFAIETKAVRKPISKDGKKTAKMSIDKGVLAFPHARTAKPIQQALVHAKWLRKKLMVEVPVIPVVALPGWYIEGPNTVDDVLVISPKRGQFLKPLVVKENIAQRDFDIIVKQIEAMARDVDHHKSLTDADANHHYNLMLNKKRK